MTDNFTPFPGYFNYQWHHEQGSPQARCMKVLGGCGEVCESGKPCRCCLERMLSDALLREEVNRKAINRLLKELDTHGSVTAAIGEAVGFASMCWDPKPDGVYQVKEAETLVNELVSLIKDQLNLEISRRNFEEVTKTIKNSYYG